MTIKQCSYIASRLSGAFMPRKIAPAQKTEQFSITLPSQAVKMIDQLIGVGLHGNSRAKIGVDEKEANIRNKLARGKFSAAFLVQCLSAIGASDLRI